MKDNIVDVCYEDAKEIVISYQKVSVSFLQRKLRIGYFRAVTIIDKLEEENIIGKDNGARPRKIIQR